MGILLLKMLTGFIIGTHFGKLRGNGEISPAMGIFLTVSLTLIICSIIDFILVGKNV
jgi:hypothetical protein